MYKLIIHTGRPGDTVELYPPGRQNIMTALLSGGFMLSAPCGGGGRCGMCRVWLRGEVSGPGAGELRLLSEHDNPEPPPAEGFAPRLACRAIILGECELYFTSSNPPYALPEQAGGVINTQSVDMCADTPGFPRLSTGYSQNWAEMPDCGGLRFAFDLGTTTVSLIAARGGGIVYGSTELNAQRAFGADVISRIAYCGENGTDRPCSVIREQMFRMLGTALEKLGCPGSEQSAVIPVAGNTTMLYILCGMSPKELGLAPYIPSERFGRTEELRGDGRCFTAYLPRCTGGFTGGDLTCCLAAVEYIRNGGREVLNGENGALSPELLRGCGRILVCDLGTNGEIALYSGDEPDPVIYVTSAAAGPALEGGCISCGLGAVDGAISRIRPAGDGALRPVFDVIGGGKARGISGSALLELTALLLDNGVIDPTGRMITEEYAVCDGISFTQADVRQLQLAKGAVRAAAARLTELAGNGGEPCVPDAVIITGGLGHHVDERTVRRLGLLPIDGVPPERVFFAPALALEGALLCCGGEGRLLAERTARRCRCVELSGDGRFEELFIGSMEFPG